MKEALPMWQIQMQILSFVWCITAFSQLYNDTSFLNINQGIQVQKHLGLVVRALACGVEDPRIDNTFDWVSWKLSLFIQQKMGTWISSGLGKVYTAKVEEMDTTLHMLCLWNMWNPNIRGYGTCFYLFIQFTFENKNCWFIFNLPLKMN